MLPVDTVGKIVRGIGTPSRAGLPGHPDSVLGLESRRYSRGPTAND